MLTVQEITTLVGGAVLILMTVVQISPLKINPWSWIGNALDKEMIMKIDDMRNYIESMDSKINNLETKFEDSENRREEAEIKNCRARILRFGDEILHEIKHSKDHFDQILLDCTEYKNYCDTHSGFLNDITDQSMRLIDETYAQCMKDHSFL